MKVADICCEAGCLLHQAPVHVQCTRRSITHPSAGNALTVSCLLHQAVLHVQSMFCSGVDCSAGDALAALDAAAALEPELIDLCTARCRVLKHAGDPAGAAAAAVKAQGMDLADRHGTAAQSIHATVLEV